MPIDTLGGSSITIGGDPLAFYEGELYAGALPLDLDSLYSPEAFQSAYAAGDQVSHGPLGIDYQFATTPDVQMPTGAATPVGQFAAGAPLTPGALTAGAGEIIQDALANDIFGQYGVDADGALVNASTGQKVDPTTPEGKGVLASISDALKPVESALGTNTGKILAALGLGAVGLLISQAATGGGSKLTIGGGSPTPPPAAVGASQEALNRALTTPSGTLAGSPFAPSATAGQDLEQIFRSGLAGQRNIADLALGLTGRELGAEIEQGPHEAALRMAGLTRAPQFLAPAPGSTLPAPGVTNQGQGIISMLAGQAGNVAPGQDAALAPRLATFDPVRAGLQEQLMRALNGQLPTPQLDAQFAQERAELNNRLQRQLGPGYELSTPGGDELRRLADSQALRKEQYRQSIIATLGAQEAQRGQFGESLGEQTRQFGLNFGEGQRQFNTGFGQGQMQYLAGLAEQQRQFNEQLLNQSRQFQAGFGEQQRQAGLNEAVGLTGLGRTPIPQLATTLTGLTPTQPLLGLGDTAAAARQQESLQAQAAMNAFNLQAQENRDRAQAISGLFGTAAGFGLGGRSRTTVNLTQDPTTGVWSMG